MLKTHSRWIHSFLVSLALLSCLLWSETSQAISFRQFKTEHGLRVWLLPQKGVQTIQIVVHIPVGSTQDPKRKEGLAHFVEHMLFTDNDGRDELEFFKELESHGGKANGYTNREETVYLVAAPAKETPLALDWIRKLIFDHQFKEEAVKKERKIVLLETNLNPPELMDYYKEVYYYIERIFEEPGFWQREFGLKSDRREVGGTYHTLNRITLKDIQKFYNTHYGLNGITIFIAGSFNPKEVEKRIRKEFFYSKELDFLNQSKSSWGEKPKIKIKKKYRQEVDFIHTGSLNYRTQFKIPEPSQKDALYLFFLRDFLREYFNDELRFKDRATYGVGASMGFFRNAAYFDVSGNFAQEDYQKSRAKIEEAIEKIRSGEFSKEDFKTYKKRARASLELKTPSPEGYAGQFQSYFHNAEIFQFFPDQIKFYRSVSFDDIQAFSQKWFVKENQIRYLTLHAPLSDTVKQVLYFIVFLAVFFFLRKRWIHQVDLRELRYLRKIRIVIPQKILFWGIFVIAYIFYQRTIELVFDRFENLYIHFESFWIHYFLELSVLSIWIYLSILPFTFFPRKVMLFSDYILIKFWTYRSWKIPYDKVQKVGTFRGHQLFQKSKNGIRWPIWPLAFGLIKPAIYLKGKGYPAFFFQTRNNPEFLECLEKLQKIHPTEKTV